jgi:hypothetical protein
VKFIASSIGRCVQLFSWEEVRPPHGISSAMLAIAIAERYGFQVRPNLPIPPDSVVRFGDGSVAINSTMIAIQKLESYSDGLAIDCSNTDDAKLVVDDLIKWAQSDLGFKEFIRPPRVTFVSQVTVEFAPEFENIFKWWKKLQTLLNASAQGRYGFTQNINIHRLQWRADPHTTVNASLVSDFWMERKIGEPHSSNRWSCTGSLPTGEWVALLEAIEGVALG